MGQIIFTLLLIVFLFTLICIVYWWININNVEIKLRNQGEAQQTVCTTIFDRMRKTIMTVAQVKDDYLNSFENIFSSIMNGRYSGEETLMKWIKEANPEFSEKIFKKLMVVIETQRQSFQRAQELLIDIDRQHKTFRQCFPNNLFIGGRPDLVLDIITSTNTNAAIEIGRAHV